MEIFTSTETIVYRCESCNATFACLLKKSLKKKLFKKRVYPTYVEKGKGKCKTVSNLEEH